MKRTLGAALTVAMSAMFPITGQGEQAPQDDPYSKLAFFEGTWTVKGSESTYRETCEWFQNRRFLVCKGEDTEGPNPDWTMSIFGYSKDKQAYTHTVFPTSGVQRTILGWVHGTTWIFTGESQAGGDTSRSHVTIAPTKKGFTFRREVSINGLAWKRMNDFTYVRLP